MDDRPSKADDPETGTKKPGRSLGVQRQQAGKLLAAQQDRLEQVEAHLGSQLQELSESVIHEVNDRFQAERDELDRRADELTEQARDLDRRCEEQAVAEQRLGARQEELARREEQSGQLQREWSESHQRTARQHQQLSEQLRAEQDDLHRQRTELDAAQAQHHQARRTLKRDEEERELEAEDFVRRRERVVELEGRLSRQAEELELRREQTRNQRRRIAHELQAQRAAQQHEVESLRHKLELLQSTHQRACKEETSQLEEQRRGLDRKLEQQQQEFQAVRIALENKTAALEQAHVELELRERRLAEDHSAENQRLAEEVERLTVELAETQSQLNLAASQPAAADESELVAWRTERETLIERLANAESRLANADPQRSADLERRFELAIEDVRALKRSKSELEEELAELRATGLKPGAPLLNDSADWESQKRKLLASLEPDASAIADDDRLTVESTIQITDEIVAQKDRDIAELKRILAQQSDNIGSVSIGAAAVAETLDQDELIQQERAKLRKLQEEWREKVRQSEIDISIERARMARQRAEIEDKVSTYETERAKNPLETEGANLADGTKRPARGRWLARLGLKDSTD